MIDELFSGKFDTAIGRDIKLNLKKFLGESELTVEESGLVLLGLSASLKSKKLEDLARHHLSSSGLAEEILEEARQAGALMGLMNTYYRFRYMIEETSSEKRLPDDYRVAGLRMNGMLKPLMGKVPFELVAFAVSVLNGCKNCIAAHEKTLMDHQVSRNKIHDLARLAAVAKACDGLFNQA
ncbi:MAG: carboxymuconolactone decarboxylase family protein [Candidatus Cloacimonetes bacterium]|nr:carboxymuconolactone decarboxylase family protein [Candidatus Cloacimonadota bacterium]